MRKQAALGILFFFLAASLFAGGNGDLRKNEHALEDKYIVVFEDFVTDVRGTANALAHVHGGAVGYIYESAVKGFSVTLPAHAAKALAGHAEVQYVEEDGVVTADTTQSGATWGLDRIDQ